ncbi:MAG: hypothetical protein V5783_08110 [Pontiella sp.]
MKLWNIILGVGIFLVATSTQAAVIASDDFATDGDLLGSTGGIGFIDAWSEGTYTISDGVVSGSGNSYRTLSNPIGSNGTIWVSFDMGRTSAVSSYGGFSFFSNTTERLLIGDYYGEEVWGIDGKTGSSKVITDFSMDGFKTAVAKITLGAGASSVVELWMGEAGGIIDCSGAADASITGVTLEGVTRVRIGAGFAIDFADLVLGDSADDVPAMLADTSFNADTTGSWTDAGNWSDGVPSVTERASILSGAVVTLDAAVSALSLGVKNSTALEIAEGGMLTTTGYVKFGDTSVTVGVGAGSSSGKLYVGGVLELGDASLVIEGTFDGDGCTIAYATNGLVGEFSNYSDEAFVQTDGELNYYIHYITNASPNYITINTNGTQSAEIELPPRPSEQFIVDGFDQRYMAYDYDAISGVWTDSAGSANATAINSIDFTITTNTPNGRPAVVNRGLVGDGTAMNFTRASAVATNGFTIQAVIRLDADVAPESRRGPFACDEATGWSGLYMGAQAGSSSQIRSGNLGDTQSGDYVLAGSVVNTLEAGTWGIYTLVVDPMADDQMVATFDLLSDGSTAFTITASVPGDTNWVGGISASGRLFGGDMGGSADADTDNWMGAIADLVVYDYVLSSDDLATNEEAFQIIYRDEVVYETSVGDVTIVALPSGTDVVISWATSEYGTFALESTENISYPVWTNVASGLPGTGSDISVTTTVSSVESFYRAYIED